MKFKNISSDVKLKIQEDFYNLVVNSFVALGMEEYADPEDFMESCDFLSETCARSLKEVRQLYVDWSKKCGS